MRQSRFVMCKICQYGQKQNTQEQPHKNPCFALGTYHRYPPAASRPHATIGVDCKNFSHINGGRVTIRAKKRIERI